MSVLLSIVSVIRIVSYIKRKYIIKGVNSAIKCLLMLCIKIFDRYIKHIFSYILCFICFICYKFYMHYMFYHGTIAMSATPIMHQINIYHAVHLSCTYLPYRSHLPIVYLARNVHTTQV